MVSIDRGARKGKTRGGHALVTLTVVVRMRIQRPDDLRSSHLHHSLHVTGICGCVTCLLLLPLFPFIFLLALSRGFPHVLSLRTTIRNRAVSFFPRRRETASNAHMYQSF